MQALLRAFAVLPAAALLTACEVALDSQGHTVHEEKRFTVSATPEVRLTTFDGSIDIRSWDKAEVLVEIEKHGPTEEAIAQLQVTSQQDGNRVEVEVKKPAGSGEFFGFGRYSPSAKLIVTLPQQSNVVARSGDGSIRAGHVRGRLELRTGDGSIHANGVSGDLTCHTGDGSVVLEEAEGRLDLETGDGGVNVSGRFGAVKLHTGDGSIVFRAESGSAMTDDWSVTTGDGGVTLYLPADFAGEVDAHTGDGRIRNDLKLTGSSGDEANRRSVRGRLGAGGRTLRIRTGDGGIRLSAS
jgi:Putative adhesin